MCYLLFFRLERLRVRLHVAPLLVFSLILALIGCRQSQQPTSTPPDVEVVEVMQKDVPIWKEWIGTLDGLWNAQSTRQVSGSLLRKTYNDGGYVKKDQLMFEFDPLSLQAAVYQHKRHMSNAKGKLAAHKTNQTKAQNHVNGFTPLA